MNLAYMHVVINHFPIMGVPIGLGLLALGAYARNEPIKRAALLVFVFVGLVTIAVFLLGRAGHESIEHLPGVSEAAVDAHGAMAGAALLATELLALLSLVVFARYGGPAMLSRTPRAVVAAPVPGWAVAVVFVVGLVAAGVLGYTGKLGGQIRHTEFVHGGATTVQPAVDDDDDELAPNAEPDAH
jgi:hypothetical protein